MLIYCLCDKSPALSGRRSPSGSSWVRSICRFSCGLRDLQAGLLMQPGASVSIEVSSYSLSLISSSTSFFSSLLCLTFTFLLPSISSFSFLLSLFSAYTFLSSSIYFSSSFCLKYHESFLVDLLLLLLQLILLPLCLVAICLLLFSPLSSLAAPSPIFLYPLSAVTSASLLPPPLSPT